MGLTVINVAVDIIIYFFCREIHIEMILQIYTKGVQIDIGKLFVSYLLCKSNQLLEIRFKYEIHSLKSYIGL